MVSEPSEGNEEEGQQGMARPLARGRPTAAKPLCKGAAGCGQAPCKGRPPAGAVAHKWRPPAGAAAARGHDRLRPTCKGRLPATRLQGGSHQRLARGQPCRLHRRGDDGTEEG
ncbi:hypothetical protein GW17_00061106 [Ensete ventricosum]|nr:hypothetical protein GW17_00061106 [Ensete ventricosum]